ncbi:hypothetical protein DFS33DRAFT_183281 [Desarmillaria ectypa]|nr:hypothetical protein DFS33DRAFT_183281 [Desarmillaria ectypa]
MKNVFQHPPPMDRMTAISWTLVSFLHRLTYARTLSTRRHRERAPSHHLQKTTWLATGHMLTLTSFQCDFFLLICPISTGVSSKSLYGELSDVLWHERVSWLHISALRSDLLCGLIAVRARRWRDHPVGCLLHLGSSSAVGARLNGILADTSSRCSDAIVLLAILSVTGALRAAFSPPTASV